MSISISELTSKSHNAQLDLSGTSLSLTSEVLSALGCEDRRSEIIEANQANGDICRQLNSAISRYERNPSPKNQNKLIQTLNREIKRLTSLYNDYITKRDAHKLSALHSRSDRAVTGWYDSFYYGAHLIKNAVQTFFGSDDVSLFQKYSEAAKSHEAQIHVLKKYRDEILASQNSQNSKEKQGKSINQDKCPLNLDLGNLFAENGKLIYPKVKGTMYVTSNSLLGILYGDRDHMTPLSFNKSTSTNDLICTGPESSMCSTQYFKHVTFCAVTIKEHIWTCKLRAPGIDVWEIRSSSDFDGDAVSDYWFEKTHFAWSEVWPQHPWSGSLVPLSVVHDPWDYIGSSLDSLVIDHKGYSRFLENDILSEFEDDSSDQCNEGYLFNSFREPLIFSGALKQTTAAGVEPSSNTTFTVTGRTAKGVIAGPR